MVGECGEHEQVVGSSRVAPKTDSRCGRSLLSGSQPQPCHPGLQRVRPGLAHLAHCAADARVRPATLDRPAAANPIASTSRPWTQLSIMVGRVAAYLAKRPARCRAVDQRRPASDADPDGWSARWRRGNATACRPRLAAAAVDHPKQRPYGAVRLPWIDVLVVRAACQAPAPRAAEVKESPRRRIRRRCDQARPQAAARGPGTASVPRLGWAR